MLDDELNVLPISRGKDIQPLENSGKGKAKDPAQTQLIELRDSLADTKPAGDLVKLAKTLDQAQAILTFIDAIAEKTLSSTVTLTAGRGRGKSAALGLAIAAALAHGYANIFVTSPSPDNLKTLFEFVFKGLDALGYEEHLDYDIAVAQGLGENKEDTTKSVVRVNVFRDHRQTVQVRYLLSVRSFLSQFRRSISLLKMPMYSVKLSWSSSMKPPPFLSLLSAILLVHTSSSLLPPSTVMKGQVARFRSSLFSNYARARDLH